MCTRTYVSGGHQIGIWTGAMTSDAEHGAHQNEDNKAEE